MPILEYSLDDAWLAMPVAERNLTQAIERDGDIGEFGLVPVVRGLAEGLKYAHDRDCVHRDLSPNNVLELGSGDDSIWVVSDWGLVRRPGRQSSPRLTGRDAAIGTEGFMAPEAKLDPRNANSACDVYSLGQTALFACTSVWPRTGFPVPAVASLWDELVTVCTAPAGERPSSMSAVLSLLAKIEAEVDRRLSVPDLNLCPQCQVPVSGARCEACGRMWD